MTRVLIVEDEPKLAALIADYFRQSEFECHILNDGADVIPWVKSNEVDLVLLDVMLPHQDGMSLCREIRSFSSVPIMFLTARAEEIDRLLGLELGADDYICKPFSSREVVARAKAILRRVRPGGLSANTAISLDSGKWKATVFGRDMELTAVEFALLKTMVDQPGRVFSRAQLMESIYDDHRIVSERTIDSHIKKIRKRISALTEKELIHSVYGVGYKFEPEE